MKTQKTDRFFNLNMLKFKTTEPAKFTREMTLSKGEILYGLVVSNDFGRQEVVLFDHKFRFIKVSEYNQYDDGRGSFYENIPFLEGELEEVIKDFTLKLSEPLVKEKERLEKLKEYGLEGDEEHLIPYIDIVKTFESSTDIKEKAKILLSLREKL